MSSKYLVNWALSGFRDREHKAGDVIEAAEQDAEKIAALVNAGVLTLINKIKGEENAVSFTEASTDDLVRYAKEKFGFDLDPTLSKDAMLAEIASLKAGKGSSDDNSGAPTELSSKTRAELVAYAKENFGYDLKGNLSKDAMLAEINSLEKK